MALRLSAFYDISVAESVASNPSVSLKSDVLRTKAYRKSRSLNYSGIGTPHLFRGTR